MKENLSKALDEIERMAPMKIIEAVGQESDGAVLYNKIIGNVRAVLELHDEISKSLVVLKRSMAKLEQYKI